MTTLGDQRKEKIHCASSGNVRWMEYDPETQTVRVAFIRSGIYRYGDEDMPIPPETWSNLKQAEFSPRKSVTETINRELKEPGFPFEKE